MIILTLQFLRDYFLNSITSLERGFVAIDYTQDGIYFYGEPSGDKRLLNFDSSYGNHFYIRVNGEIDIIESYYRSNIRTFVHSLPIRLVAMVSNKNLKSDYVYGLFMNALEFPLPNNQFNIYFEPKNANLDKYLVFAEELKVQKPEDMPDLDLFSVIRIDGNLKFEGAFDPCFNPPCC